MMSMRNSSALVTMYARAHDAGRLQARG